MADQPLTSSSSPQRCQLLSGTGPLLVQGLLFVISGSVLLARKLCDAARRSWLEFGLDSSKQVIGAGWLHCINLVASIVPTLHSEHWGGGGGGGGGAQPQQPYQGPCELYFVNLLLDTTLGVAIEAVLLRAVVGLIAHERLDEPGEYYDDRGRLRLGAFGWQLLLWLMVVTAMKACITLIISVNVDAWQAFAVVVLAPVRSDPRLELLFVMVLAPGLLNAFQFLCTDAFLRKQRPTPPALPEE